MVASAEGKACLDYRVGYTPVGPFETHAEFHSFLRGHIPLENCTQVYGEKVTRCHSTEYRTCFAHADLALRNLIERDGKIVAVVDWALAGWYPEYWEYTKAHYGLYNVPDWYAGLQRVMTRYDDELAAERVLWRLFDEPGVPRTWVKS